MARDADPDAGAPRQARDVMAFGQEVGRVRSDGQVVGRAEPFAKVFASSRLVKRAVGMTAWGILEDIALDATLDAEGRLVAETSARQIAANLGLNKETVSRHLARLREHGFVFHEEVRHQGSGRYETARYVLDPAACLERFTTTPPRQTRWSDPRTKNPDTGRAVSGFSGHGGTGQGSTGHGESVQPSLDKEDVVEGHRHPAYAAALEQVGVDAATATALAGEHSVERVNEVLEAVERHCPRNAAGWVITALRRGWQVANRSAAHAVTWPEVVDASTTVPYGDEDLGRRRWQAWDTVVSAALDDERLARAIRLVCRPAPGVGWVAPAVHAELIRWAAAAHQRLGGVDLAATLAAALDEGWRDADDRASDTLRAPPPSANSTGVGLRRRIEGVLARLDPPGRMSSR